VGGGLQRHQAPLDEVRHQGIRDFKTFIKVHPEFVSRCMQEIRVIDVNQQTLQMFGAQSKANCTNQISRVFRGEMHDSFAEQLQDCGTASWCSSGGGQLRPVGRCGAHPHAVAVLAGHEDDWGLVLLSWWTSRRARRPRPTWNTWASTMC
jgi:hypothetical protein